MDSRVVNKEIKREIWPLLKDNGFEKFTSRNAWRVKEETIEVVNFQSFNSYLAFGVGCTTYSFAVNIGVYYRCFEETPWFGLVKTSYPKEYASHIRKRLQKGLHQANLFHPYDDPRFHAWHKDQPDIWYVAEDGNNIAEVVDDVKQIIDENGLPWLKKMANLASALEAIENEVIANKRGMSWHNAELIASLSIKLGLIEKAAIAYQQIIDSPSYIRSHNYSKTQKKFFGEDYLELAGKRLVTLKEKFENV